MSRDAILKKITLAAARDTKMRADERYLRTMGFMLAKGFLYSNQPIRKLPNQRLHIDSVVWAGKNVEPRILEVLPAAVLRLPRHFLMVDKNEDLQLVLNALRQKKEDGPDFFGIPYKKLKVWADLSLKDRRTKMHSQKRLLKTFRFHPSTVTKLSELARTKGCTETEILEKLVAAVRND